MAECMHAQQRNEERKKKKRSHRSEAYMDEKMRWCFKAHFFLPFIFFFRFFLIFLFPYFGSLVIVTWDTRMTLSDTHTVCTCLNGVPPWSFGSIISFAWHTQTDAYTYKRNRFYVQTCDRETLNKNNKGKVKNINNNGKKNTNTHTHMPTWLRGRKKPVNNNMTKPWIYVCVGRKLHRHMCAYYYTHGNVRTQ